MRTRRRIAAEEYKLFVEGVEDYGIFLVDLGGRVVTWNAGAERILGYTADEVVGRHLSLFYRSEDVCAGKPEEELQNARARGRFETEAWRVRKDGKLLWASVLTTKLVDASGRHWGFGKVTRDMTAARHAELELEEGAARLTAMVSGALDCIITIDARGNVLEWNPAAEQTFGWTREEVYERPLAELVVPPHLQGAFSEGLARFRRTGETPVLGQRFEMPAVRRDGKRLLMEVSVVRVSVGESETFTGFARDISARKRADKQNAELVEKAQEAVRARDEFLAIASHELRTPLAALILQLDGLEKQVREQAAAPDNARLLEKVQKAARTTGRLAALIDSLIDSSKLATGRLELHPEPVDVCSVLRKVTDRVGRVAAREGSSLLVRAPESLSGCWDGLRMEQVIENLLSNALKYGRGHPIEVELRTEGEMVRMTIVDHGIGIPPEDVARIFGRFERAVPVRHYGGFGLGLYTTRQIVEAHGGAIRVMSAPGVGSTFTVEVPRFASTPVARPELSRLPS